MVNENYSAFLLCTGTISKKLRNDEQQDPKTLNH